MQVVGNYLAQNEKDELLKFFKNSDSFQDLVEAIVPHLEEKNIKVEELKVALGVKQDVRYGEEKNVIALENIVLEHKDSILISLTKIDPLETDKQPEVQVYAKIKRTESGNTTQYIYVVNEEDIGISKSIIPEDQPLADEGLKTEQDFIVDENYTKGQMLEQVNAEAYWWRGCLPNGYQWCGDHCGGGSRSCSSSDPGKNGLDKCCRAHDCCFHRTGVSFPNLTCDRTLCKCAVAAPKTAATITVTAAMCAGRPW